MRANRKKTIRTALLMMVLLLGIGFAALAANLKIDGTLNVSRTSWDVHFENVQVTEGSVTANPAPTSDDTTTTEMTYTINFTKPGDFFEFTTDIVNEGTIDAMIQDVSNNVYANAQSTTPITLPSYLTSTVTYSDGVPIQQNQILPKKNGNTKTVETIKVRIEFKKDISVNDLPSDGDTTIVFKFIGDYKQADEYSIPVRNVCNKNMDGTVLSLTKCNDNENITPTSNTICKRAINLHQEECTIDHEYYQCSGAGYTENGTKGTTTITYGNCGTQGASLVNGDAFTCDVNGDGIFDELTERFYYVSDYYDTTTKTYDSSTAVLIYYNNVTEGIACNYKGYAYDSSNENWHGPVTAIEQLPTTSQWSNVSLKREERQILSVSTTDSTSGGTLPTDFNYSDYAARLLTYQEINSACRNSFSSSLGKLDSCNYLMENTVYAHRNLGGIYGIWLENPHTSVSTYAIFADGVKRSSNNANVNRTDYGVRPAIEVPKTSMSY